MILILNIRHFKQDLISDNGDIWNLHVIELACLNLPDHTKLKP